MHSGDNKEAFPYTAIKSNDIKDFLGNSNGYGLNVSKVDWNWTGIGLELDWNWSGTGQELNWKWARRLPEVYQK